MHLFVFAPRVSALPWSLAIIHIGRDWRESLLEACIREMYLETN